MEISEEDFALAIETANDYGHKEYKVNIHYIPPSSGTQVRGQLIIDAYRLTATGEREK